MKPEVVTIGAYGFVQEEFFHALLYAHVDLLCDLRHLRGMRGTTYTFANSKRLQQRLAELGIRYLHLKELSPTSALRQHQQQEDEKLAVAKRARSTLAWSFIQEYEQTYLVDFDAHAFIERLGPGIDVIALFCVERNPEACHRSLVAAKLARDLGLAVKHIMPISSTID